MKCKEAFERTLPILMIMKTHLPHSATNGMSKRLQLGGLLDIVRATVPQARGGLISP